MHTLEELRAHLADVKSRMQEMDGEAVGRVFTSEEQSEFDALKEERSTTESTITHLEERTAYVEEMSASTENRDEPTMFQVRRSGVARGDDIYDLSTIRIVAWPTPRTATRELRDRAMRSVEAASFPTQVEHERAQGHIARLLDTIDGEHDGKGRGRARAPHPRHRQPVLQAGVREVRSRGGR
jgi:hypothetical protein